MKYKKYMTDNIEGEVKDRIDYELNLAMSSTQFEYRKGGIKLYCAFDGGDMSTDEGFWPPVKDLDRTVNTYIEDVLRDMSRDGSNNYHIAVSGFRIEVHGDLTCYEDKESAENHFDSSPVPWDGDSIVLAKLSKEDVMKEIKL